MIIFKEPLIVFPLIGAIGFGIAYIYSDKVLNWLHDKTLGKREYILEKFKVMFVETDPKKVTLLMLAVSVGPGFLVAFSLLPNLKTGIFLGLIITFAGWQIPKVVVDILFKKRCGMFADQMVDGLTLLANGVRSGLTVAQAMERVVDNMENPISQEFGLVLSELRLGLSLEEALNNLYKRIQIPDVNMFVTAVNILKETGGDMSETFSTIVETIRERQKVQKKIETLTAQGLMQGIIITAIPFVILIVTAMLDPEYVKPLFTTVLGIVMLVFMLGLQIVGGLVIKKIITIEA